ncbi:uncharacterized protein LOC34617471, partial [Cyclospora cayetanensis]|uniref:Uncharacterized protein LOC34617471 n=1 Tax=Cyclospora cayetanensis TaxID=88456 RepID=A0A6P6S0Q5_9EIME
SPRKPLGTSCTDTSSAAALAGSACLLLASLLRVGSQEQLLQYPLLQQPEQMQALLQQLLEDRAAAVQAAALQAYKHLVRQSKGQQQQLTVCWGLLPTVHAAVTTAATAAAQGAGDWKPIGEALVAAKWLCRMSAQFLHPPNTATAASAAAQICELAFAHLFSTNPVAEQLLLQLLRVRAGSGGVTEAAANSLLADLEGCSSSSTLTGRRLQQLGDYFFRVLLRVHAEAAAAQDAEGFDSSAEDAAPASALQLEAELAEENWELVV